MTDMIIGGGDPALLNGITTNTAPSRVAESDAAEVNDRLTSALVRRMCVKHPCTPQCRHRNHRRDMAEYTLMLEALDLTGTLARSEDYRHPVEWHALTRREVHTYGGAR